MIFGSSINQPACLCDEISWMGVQLVEDEEPFFMAIEMSVSNSSELFI
jgi:hypothetical protein